ncbi:hypothetical protein [Candidatus Thiodictyon syntrophicum]|uniref:hypothetical protein n=1 Tax=Candidatus Thiodictyon syntrophicum TaxID=1166950 RepID=UPI0012FDAF89|nr:hypothetical protein [Candidatus Thiodictyon syntrophicum]
MEPRPPFHPCTIPTPEQLREVLEYSFQARNFIAVKAAKAMPQQWKRPPMAESDFYAALLSSTNDDDLLHRFAQVFEKRGQRRASKPPSLLLPWWQFFREGARRLRRELSDGTLDQLRHPPEPAGSAREIVQNAVDWVRDQAVGIPAMDTPAFRCVHTWLVDRVATLWPQTAAGEAPDDDTAPLAQEDATPAPAVSDTLLPATAGTNPEPSPAPALGDGDPDQTSFADDAAAQLAATHAAIAAWQAMPTERSRINAAIAALRSLAGVLDRAQAQRLLEALVSIVRERLCDTTDVAAAQALEQLTSWAQAWPTRVEAEPLLPAAASLGKLAGLRETAAGIQIALAGVQPAMARAMQAQDWNGIGALSEEAKDHENGLARVRMNIAHWLIEAAATVAPAPAPVERDGHDAAWTPTSVPDEPSIPLTPEPIQQPQRVALPMSVTQPCGPSAAQPAAVDTIASPPPATAVVIPPAPGPVLSAAPITTPPPVTEPPAHPAMVDVPPHAPPAPLHKPPPEPASTHHPATGTAPTGRLATTGNAPQRLESPVASWPAQTSLHNLLAAAHPTSGHLTDDAANAAVWVLVRDGQPALAYHLANSLETRGALAAGIFTARSLSTLVLAPLVNAGTDAVVEPLREGLSDLLLADLDRREVRQRRANGLLVLAMTLRPALIAPYHTSARSILESQYQQIEREVLRAVAMAVIDAGRLRATLSEAAFKGESSAAARARERSQLREQTEAFLREAQHKTIKYAAATRVWKHWLETGDLAELLHLVIADDVSQLDLVRSLAADWRDRAKVLARVRVTDDECRKGGAKMRPIEGAAREDLVQAALEAVGYVETWCRLNEHEGDNGDGSGPTGLSEWVSRTRSLIGKAIDELRPLIGSDLLDQAALASVVAALIDLNDLIDPELKPLPRLPWQQMLGQALVPIPGLVLNACWEPDEGPGSGIYESLLIAQGMQPNSLAAAFDRADADCLHETTARVIALGHHVGEPLIEDWSRRREHGIERCKRRLHDGLREAERSIAHALDFGFLDETTRSTLAEQLEALAARTDTDFGIALGELVQIEATLAEHKRHRVDAERERLAAHDDLRRNPVLRERVHALLDKGDIVTATEYVTHAENGTEPPHDHREPQHQRAFFPGFVAAAAASFGEQRTREIIDRCAPETWPAELAPRPARFEEALALLRAWGQAVRYAEAGQDVAAMTNLFRLLGFEAVKAISLPARRASSRDVQIETQRIQDRDLCPIPAFGSRAHGRYRLVCTKPGASWAEEIAGAISGGRDPVLPGVPVLVFYPGRLSVAERRTLARRSREKGQTFLLLDEWLVLYLAGCAPAERLKAFFECTLPFTAVDPYSSTGGDVPDELFMGRREAIARIVDRQGTNLVYGGRQLGKTALLKEVQRRHHSPDSGFHVVWIDLNEKEIGRGRPPAEVWLVIASNLDKQIVKDQVQRADTIQRQIEDWLNADERRRLLLLLDESDNFFAQDAEDGYPVLRALKGVMDRTARRFKVVMAGLHNVQRASRDPNTPVAHLAQPLCVGPLIENGEAREAFRLVTMPLRALGYTIDDDVVNRILAYANYAPNLIQDFCSKLLQYLNDANQANFDPEQTPPYQISSGHVETAYQRRDLRTFIRDRFQITLALDPRYRLIALAIARETLQRRDEAVSSASGFPVVWIRDQALGRWERGFPDRTAEAFRVLLDEMVGLGILRCTEGNYALRSPNLVNLLGARGSIEQDLQDAAAEEPPPPYTAAVHRRPRGSEPWMRSPLTAEQEHRLLQPSTGISLVFGLVLAGIEEVAPALQEAAATLPGIEVQWQSLEPASHLPAALRQALDRQGENTHLIYLVTNAADWSTATVAEVQRVLTNRRSKSRTVRVVFIGDARRAWCWHQAAPVAGRILPELISLKPWASETLKVWLRDNRLGSIEPARLERLTAATGLWHGPLQAALAPLVETPERWRETIDLLAPDVAADALREEFDTLAEVLDILRTMAIWRGEPLSAEELSLLDAEPDQLEVVLAWGETTGVIRAEPQGARRLDPYLAELLPS